jgi:hypothetical protein
VGAGPAGPRDDAGGVLERQRAPAAGDGGGAVAGARGHARGHHFEPKSWV